MKRVVFITSHLGSGSEAFCSLLGANSRITYCNSSDIIYDYFESLYKLTGYEHKNPDGAAIWLDHILFNHQFSCRDLLNVAQFIYIIREPYSSLVNNTPYYTFRLKRMVEMARKTKNAVLLTWEDLAAGRYVNLINEFLILKEPLIHQNVFPLPQKSHSLLKIAEESYERNYYAFQQISHLRRCE